MTDFSSWDEKHIFVSRLNLDPANPRIPPAATIPGQRDLIGELVEHEDVYELAGDIARNGYTPVESLIGLKDTDGKEYILEGNRRLAALKLLHSPESAPDKYVARFRKLASVGDPPKKVRVLFAPSRQAAAPLILRKHTRTQIEKWSPVMQARFYKSLTDGGLTPEELGAEYGVKPSQVRKFLRDYEIYDVACSIPLPDSVKDEVHNPRTFSLTILQRLIDAPNVRKALGIDVTSSGSIKGGVPAPAFQKAFGRILTDIVEEKVNTRTLNSATEIDKYLNQIKPVLPDKRKRGSFTSADLKRGSVRKPAPAPKPTIKAPKPAERARMTLVTRAGACPSESPRVKAIWKELRYLRLDKNPNAIAVLIRMTLEMVVGEYLERTKKIQPLLNKAKQNNRRAEWYPPLRQLLQAVVQDQSVNLPPLARKKLNQLLASQNSPHYIDNLDGYVHNRYQDPTPHDLRVFWDVLEPLFAEIDPSKV